MNVRCTNLSAITSHWIDLYSTVDTADNWNYFTDLEYRELFQLSGICSSKRQLPYNSTGKLHPSENIPKIVC